MRLEIFKDLKIFLYVELQQLKMSNLEEVYTADTFIEICDRINAFGFSFDEITLDANGKKQMPNKAWSKVHRNNWKKHVKYHHNGFAIKTGKESGITVIDCDSLEAYNKIVGDFPELDDTFKVQTRKGFHLFCKYEPKAGTVSTDSFVDYPKIDIRNDRGIVFAPPSTYDGFTYSVVDMDAPLVVFPEKLIANLKAQTSEIPQQIADPLQPLALPHKVPSSAKPKFVMVDEPYNTESANEIDALLSALPVAYFDDYSTWRKVGCIIFDECGNSKQSKELFLKFSKVAPNHNNVTMGDIEKEWAKFIRGKFNRATKATLYQAVKERNPKAFVKLQKRFREFDFTQQTHTSCADYFIKHYAQDFCVTEVSSDTREYYYWNGDVWLKGLTAIAAIVQIISGMMFEDLKLYLKKTNKATKDKEQEKLRLRMRANVLLLGSRPYIESIVKQVKDWIPVTKAIFDVNDEQLSNLHFSNGVLMLDHVNDLATVSNAFRTRIKTDYVTKTLSYPFKAPSIESIEKVANIYKQIQPEEDQRNFQLQWLAYCLFGTTEAHKFKLNIGHTTRNGKSLEAKIHNACFDIYTEKLEKSCFNEGNQKRHKFMKKLIINPIRYAFVEELDNKRIDKDFLKDFTDGFRLNLELMFGTEIAGKIQAKLTAISNNDVNLKGEKAVVARAIQQQYTSQFLENMPTDYVYPKNCFPMVKGLEKIFANDELKNAYLWLLLPFVITFNKDNLIVPHSFTQAFADTADEYDEFKNALNDAYEPMLDAKLGKDEFVDYFKKKLGAHWNWTRILGELKSLGYVYERTVRVHGVKGAIIGLSKLPAKCKIDLEEPQTMIEVGRYYPFSEIGLGLGGRPILEPEATTKLIKII